MKLMQVWVQAGPKTFNTKTVSTTMKKMKFAVAGVFTAAAAFIAVTMVWNLVDRALSGAGVYATDYAGALTLDLFLVAAVTFVFGGFVVLLWADAMRKND